MSSRRETRANANVVAEGQLDNETPLSPPPPSLVPPVPPMGKGAGGVPQAPVHVQAPAPVVAANKGFPLELLCSLGGVEF
ncbi:hypothetical protein V6N13_019640 [Hibiscus sabdariffa]